ncbi:MAG: HD domain-containing protein [Oscillospiraceae bacterium]|nr:HD domain-containing protein [Oscillospiraceae bacterium]
MSATTHPYNPLEHRDTSVFRDPIHGLIPVYEWELALIDTEAFQRLRRIHQLSMTYYVYHGAEHTRFGHSIGAMHIAGRIMDHLRGYEPLHSLSEEMFFEKRALVRMVALLHDLGHGCFSHVGEGASIYPQIEDPATGGFDSGHEVYTRKIIKEKLSDTIEKYWPQYDMVNQILKVHSQGSYDSFRFFDDIISGQLDCDKMDYLLRDSHYCGVQYGVYDLDKLIHSLRIAKIAGNNVLAISQNGIQAVEGFVLARYWMFIQVYFHKDRRLFDYYLTGFIKQYLLLEQSKTGQYPIDVNDYIALDDGIILGKIQYYAGKKDAEDTRQISYYAKKLYYRMHHKVAFDPPYVHLNPEDIDQKEAYNRISFVKKNIGKYIATHKWEKLDVYVDLAKGSSTKHFFEIKAYDDELDRNYDPEKLTEKESPAIPVISKLSKEETIIPEPIQDYSFTLRSISDRKINILRIYAEENIFDDVKERCTHWFSEEYTAKKKKIAEKKLSLQTKKRELDLLAEEISRDETELSEDELDY